MTKYQEYYKRMCEEHAETFQKFREVHTNYQNGHISQEEYNNEGKPIISLIREYEDRLCNHSEGSGYASYSGNLAEKFWGEIRKDFPLIDRVGVIIKKVEVAAVDFELRKINLV